MGDQFNEFACQVIDHGEICEINFMDSFVRSFICPVIDYGRVLGHLRHIIIHNRKAVSVTCCRCASESGDLSVCAIIAWPDACIDWSTALHAG